MSGPSYGAGVAPVARTRSAAALATSLWLSLAAGCSSNAATDAGTPAEGDCTDGASVRRTYYVDADGDGYGVPGVEGVIGCFETAPEGTDNGFSGPDQLVAVLRMASTDPYGDAWYCAASGTRSDAEGISGDIIDLSGITKLVPQPVGTGTATVTLSGSEANVTNTIGMPEGSALYAQSRCLFLECDISLVAGLVGPATLASAFVPAALGSTPGMPGCSPAAPARSLRPSMPSTGVAASPAASASNEMSCELAQPAVIASETMSRRTCVRRGVAPGRYGLTALKVIAPPPSAMREPIALHR